MAALPSWIVVFHQLRLSMEHHVWVSTIAPGWGVSQPKSVYISPAHKPDNTSPAETRLLLSRRERWIFNNRGVILTLIIHWLGPPLFLPRCSEAKLAIWSERLAKGPYQTNTPPTVRLKPAICINLGSLSTELGPG